MSKEIKSAAEEIIEVIEATLPFKIIRHECTMIGIERILNNHNQQFQAPVTDEEIEEYAKQAASGLHSNVSTGVYSGAINAAKWMRERMASDAVEFFKWASPKYANIHSEKLNKSAWVSVEHGILINGSDYHYTTLIEKHGQTIEDIYTKFLNRERSH